MKTKVIGVCGGSGSGKTTLCRKIIQRLGPQNISVVLQDSYYRDQSAKFDYDGGKVNFDHPDAIDFPLMALHLAELKQGHSIHCPIYDFTTHQRLAETHTIPSRPIILVDGTLILSQPNIVHQLDQAVFLQVPEKTRFLRRLKRDVEERGRTPQGVEKQFYAQVKPMFDEFVEPSKHFAHVIIHNDQEAEQFIQGLSTKLNQLVD